MRVFYLSLCVVTALFAQTAAGLKWTMPAGWTAEGARPMRAATYHVPKAASDPDTAECAVYFFGAGQGGSVEANLERWKGQFQGPNGKVADAQVQKRTIHGLAVTTISAAGEYSGMGGPMAANASGQPGYRMLGAIVQGPAGNVFLKFTGPDKTVLANQPKFEQLLASFDKTGH